MSAPPPDNRNWIDRYLDNLKSLAEDNPDDYTTVAGVPVGIHPRKLLDPPGLVGSALGLASKAVGDPLATPVTAPLGALMRAANQLPRAPWMTDEQERERAPFSDQPLIPFAGNNLDPAAYAEYAKANLEQSVPGQVALGMATPLSLLGGGFKGVGTALAKAGSPALAKAAGPLIRMDEAYTGSMDEIARLGGQFVKGPARDFGKKVPVYGKAQEWALKDSPDKIASQYMARMRDAFKSAGDAIRNDGGTGVADLARPGAAVVTNLPKGPKAFNVVGATYKTINERILGMHPEHQVAALRVFGDAIDATNAIQTRSAIERAHLFDEWGKVKGSLAGQDLIDAKAEMDMAKRLSFDEQAQSQYKDQLAVLHAFEEIEKTPITNWLDPGAATTVRAATKEAVETAHTAATEAKRYARQLRGGTEIDPTTGLSITRAPIWERPTWYDNMNALLGEDPAYREARERGLAAIRGAGLASGIDETDDLTMMARSVYAKRRQGLEGWDKPAMERMGNLKLTPQFTTVMGEALDHPKQYFNRAAKEVTAARASLTRRTEAAIVAYARSQGATQADIDAKLPALMASAKTALSNPAFIASKSVLGGTKRTDLGTSLSKLAARYDQYGDLFDPGQVDGIIAGRVGELFKREDLGIRPMRRGIVVPGIGMTAVDELQKIPGLNSAAQGLDKAWKQETIGKLNDYFIDQGMSVKDAGAEAARLAASPRELLTHPITRELLKDDLRTGAGIALGSWKEQNLLAPAYHVANVTSQAVLGTLAHAYGGDDVDPRLWMNLLRRKMNQLVKEGKVDNSFPAEISRKLAKIGGDGSEARAWDGLADTVGEPANIPGAETESATGRIPLPIRLALWGGGTAAAGYETAELAGLSPEDRAKLTGVGGLLGALYGWKVPALTKANFLLASATEKPARMAAGIATYEDEMGHVDWDAVKNAVTGRGRSLTFARDDIARLAAVTEVQTPGRRVMGPVPRDPAAPLPGPEPLPIAPEPVVAPVAEPTLVEPALAPEAAPAPAAAVPEARPRRVSSLPDFPPDGTLPASIPQTIEGYIDFGQPGIVMRDPHTGQTLETVGQTRRNPTTDVREALMRTGEQGLFADEQWRGTTALEMMTRDRGEQLAWEIEYTPPPSRAGQATLPEPVIEAEGRPLRVQLASQQPGQAGIERIGSNYGTRTDRNAADSDLTLALAADHTTGGERRTQRAAAAAKRPMLMMSHEPKPSDARRLVASLNEIADRGQNEIVLNVAGNGIYTLARQGVDQVEINRRVHALLEAAINDPTARFRITGIISGGQTGVDMAGLAAAEKLRIPALARVSGDGDRILVRLADNRDRQVTPDEFRRIMAGSVEDGPSPSGPGGPRQGVVDAVLPPEAAAPLTTPTGGAIPEGAEWMADWTQEQADQALVDSTAFLRTHRQPTPVPEEIVPEGAPDDLAEYAELAGEVTPPVAGPAAPPPPAALSQAPYEERLGRLFDLAVDRANPASQRTADSLQAPADILRENMADDGLLVPEWFDNPRFAEEVEKAVGALDPTNRQYEAVKQQAIQHVMKDFTPYSDDVTTGLAHPDAVMYRLVRSVDFESADDFADKLLEAADDMNLTLDPHLPESFDRDVQMLGTLKQIADQPLTWVEPPPGAQPAMNELLAMSPDEVNTVLPFLSPADQQRAATLWSAFDETGGRISRGLKQAIVKAQADRGLRVPGGGGGGSGLPPMGGPPAEWTWSAPDPNFQIGPLYRSQEVKQARGLAQGDMPNAPAGIDLEDFFSLGAAGPRIKVGARFNEAAFQRAFAEAHGEMNKDELYELARAHGATRQQATSLRTGWEEHDYQAKQAGTGNANNIHVDYQDIPNLLYYAKMGPSPFLTWSAKMIPKYLQIMAHHPAIPIALNEYSKATDQELEDEGLPPSFHNFVQDGGILSRLAQAVMGREGDVYANPLPALFPYSDVGREPSDYASPADVAVDTLRSVGLGPSPLITLPLYLAGLTNDLPINMLRTSPLLSAGVQALTGHAVDPEALPKRAARSIRETLAPASTQDTITGDPIKDYYVRKRIASIAAEKGHQPTGEYLKAIQTGKGPIWDLALRDVEREIGGRTLLSWTAPVRTRLVDTGEQAIREAQVETGITSGALEELNRKPLERKDLQYAAASLARNPLDQGETLEMRAKSLRVSRQFGKARSAAPITGGLSGLGADPRSEARRAQLLEQEGRRTKPLSAKAKASRERTELTRGEQVLRQMGQ